MEEKPQESGGFAEDEWIVGLSVDRERPYLIHTRQPEFLARVYDEDDPSGILDTLSVELNDGRSLANFAFFSEPPSTDELVDLIPAATQALREFYVNLSLAV